MALTIDDKPWWVGALVGIVLGVGVVWATESFLVKLERDGVGASTRAKSRSRSTRGKRPTR